MARHLKPDTGATGPRFAGRIDASHAGLAHSGLFQGVVLCVLCVYCRFVRHAKHIKHSSNNA